MAATYTTAKSGSQTLTGAGNDIIDGGNIEADIFAGDGTNLVRTGAKDDFIETGIGNDFIYAGDGDNFVDAGNGDNRVITAAGDDAIFVGKGNSIVASGAGDDKIFALLGNSIINAGVGEDEIRLRNGNNKVVLEAGEGSVTITGFDLAKDKLRLGESLMGKSLTFETKGADTLVMSGTDLLATLKGVSKGSAALIDTTPLLQYEATELKSLNTTNKNANVVVSGINDFGQIAGRYDTAGTFINENATTAVLQSTNIIRQGFVWEKGSLTALTNVGIKTGSSDLGAPSGTELNLLVANVRNISDRGLIVGTVDEVRQPIPLATDRAITWEQEGTATKYKLSINDFGGLESYFFDSNSSKQIAGRNILSDGFENPILFENGKVIDLADLGGDGGTAQGINNKGQIVGQIDKDGKLNDTAVNTAVIWNKDSGGYKLTDLGTFGAAQASLRDINDAGQIIGATSNGLSGTDAASNPFILRDTNNNGKYEASELTNLGSLGGKTGSVSGVNDFGTVVGASQTTVLGGADGKTLENHAFVWSEGKMTDLNSLVSKPITYEGAKVVLTNAVSINNFGDIAAIGTYIYKDAVTGKDVAGTRSYELKGIANKVVTGATTNPLAATATATVAQAITEPPTIVAAGNSVVNVTKTEVTPVAGIASSTMTANVLEPADPMMTSTVKPVVTGLAA
jgi:probable HAF family extracellular repeat protein